jgi:hypothetical protein
MTPFVLLLLQLWPQYDLLANQPIENSVSESSVEKKDDDIDFTLLNEESYDLSRPIFNIKPTLGRGLRDQQQSSGGSACTSCAH